MINEEIHFLLKLILFRDIEKEEGQEFAFKNNMLFFETSAKSGLNIENVSNFFLLYNICCFI